MYINGRRIDHAVFTTWLVSKPEREIFFSLSHTHTHTHTSAVYIQPALLSNPISMVKHASALDAKLSFAFPFVSTPAQALGLASSVKLTE